MPRGIDIAPISIGLAGLCDAAFDLSCRPRRCSEEKNYFFFFFAFLAFFAFFAFFAMLPSKQLSGWRCRNDAHPIRHASRCNLYSSKLKTPNPVNKK